MKKKQKSKNFCEKYEAMVLSKSLLEMKVMKVQYLYQKIPYDEWQTHNKLCSLYSNFLLLQEHFDTDKGLSFDSKPAELVTKNQEWII